MYHYYSILVKVTGVIYFTTQNNISHFNSLLFVLLTNNFRGVHMWHTSFGLITFVLIISLSIFLLYGPERLFSYSTQLSMKFILLINPKLLTIVNSFLLSIGEHETFSANTYDNANYCRHFHIL